MFYCLSTESAACYELNYFRIGECFSSNKKHIQRNRRSLHVYACRKNVRQSRKFEIVKKLEGLGTAILNKGLLAMKLVVVKITKYLQLFPIPF
jgi:hypothetical protein